MFVHKPAPPKQQPRRGAHKTSAQSIVARTIGISSPSSSAERAGSAMESMGNLSPDSSTTTQETSLAPDKTTADNHEQNVKTRALGLRPGHSVPEPLRAAMERQLHKSLPKLFVHDDDRSDAVVRMMGARAAAVDNHLLFQQNQFSPTTPTGRSLLLHEALHVADKSSYHAIHRSLDSIRNDVLGDRNVSKEEVWEISQDPVQREQLLKVMRSIAADSAVAISIRVAAIQVIKMVQSSMDAPTFSTSLNLQDQQWYSPPSNHDGRAAVEGEEADFINFLYSESRVPYVYDERQSSPLEPMYRATAPNARIVDSVAKVATGVPLLVDVGVRKGVEGLGGLAGGALDAFRNVYSAQFPDKKTVLAFLSDLEDLKIRELKNRFSEVRDDGIRNRLTYHIDAFSASADSFIKRLDSAVIQVDALLEHADEQRKALQAARGAVVSFINGGLGLAKGVHSLAQKSAEVTNRVNNAWRRKRGMRANPVTAVPKTFEWATGAKSSLVASAVLSLTQVSETSLALDLERDVRAKKEMLWTSYRQASLTFDQFDQEIGALIDKMQTEVVGLEDER